MFVTRPDKIQIDVDYDKNTFIYTEHFNLPPKSVKFVSSQTKAIIEKMFPGFAVYLIDDGIRLEMKADKNKIASGIVTEFFAHIDPDKRRNVLDMLSKLPDDFIMRETEDEYLVDYLKKSMVQTREVIEELEDFYNEGRNEEKID